MIEHMQALGAAGVMKEIKETDNILKHQAREDRTEWVKERAEREVLGTD